MVPQFEFLGELCGFYFATSAVKGFCSCANQKTLTAECAKKDAEEAKKFKLSHYSSSGADCGRVRRWLGTLSRHGHEQIDESDAKQYQEHGVEVDQRRRVTRKAGFQKRKAGVEGS